MTDSVDILIVGGTIVDGTGAPGRPGTVMVDGDRMRILPDGAAKPANAGTTIDASGKVVAPGFIDLHSHGGLVILAEPRHEPKVRQGVTTEIVGVDGNGFAPFANHDDLLTFVELDSGLDGRLPGEWEDWRALDWKTVADYLRAYDGTVSVNVGTLVGNSVLRINALGWDEVPADASALDRMAGTLRDAMADGAVGLSSGLDYPPGSFATTEELAWLTRVAGEAGGFYHTHVRYPLGDRFLDPFREAIEIGRRAGTPSHITHVYHRETHPGGADQLLALVDDARAEGLDITFDSYPYEWASTRLLIQLPQWVQAGGPTALKERIAHWSTRDRLREEFTARGAAYTGKTGWADVRLGGFHRRELIRWESRTVADVMAEMELDAVDAICDLLLLAREVHPGQEQLGDRGERRVVVEIDVRDDGDFGREDEDRAVRLVTLDHEPAAAGARVAAELRLAGADRVIQPYATAGQEMAKLMLRPQVSAFLEIVSSHAGPEFRFEEIVVTSRFREEPLQQIPLAISAITGDVLAASNATNLIDVGRWAPNVTIDHLGSGWGPTLAANIRGLGFGDFKATSEPTVSIYLDDVDVSGELRTERAGDAASKVAAVPAVRTALLQRQRDFAQPPGLVADGRDMGTVVFPAATLKVVLTASAEARAMRRHKQLKEKGIDVSLPDLSWDIAQRDARDANRTVAPFKPAPDAQLLDSTSLTPEEVVAQILQWLERLGVVASGAKR